MKFLKLENFSSQSNIKILSLNRPEVKNAFHPEMIAEITAFFEKENSNSETRMIIIRGAGNVFCSGADLNWMKDMAKYSFEENIADSKNLWKMFEALQNCSIPVVSVVHGGVFGGGLGLAACSDYVYAEEKTAFCFSEVKLGLAPAVITGFISAKIPDAFYRPLMISGETFNPIQAKNIGLVQELFSGNIDDADIVKKFAQNGTEAMRETKKLLNKIQNIESRQEKMNSCVKVISERRMSQEGQERLKKFLSKKISRVAIANRGEVAVRIIRACEELGIETVLLHSDVDMNSRAYRMATKKICIGPAPTQQSYLNIDANISAALAGGADAIHPGFGFLSENAEFAEQCEKNGLIFIGPSSESIKKLGDKVSFKKLAQGAGLPLIPGYEGEDQSISALLKQVEKIGLPVIVKAAAGGGGRGMKLIRNMDEAKDLIESAQREALSAFGSAKVFLEKYLEKAKHIEFQIFGDCTGQIQHLFDRECSVQRRHQKIIEEATSPSLTDELRRKMGEVACTIAKLGKYKNAGTVEFLLQDNSFYLLEVNTRLQVEHPVTEEVLGVDLVKMQIQTAQDNFVFNPQDIRIPRGHSIECRLYAENSYMNGMPSTGKLGSVIWPEGPRRRFEYGFESGDYITSHYDPMIAKLIVWDENRSRAIDKMIRVLKDSLVFGVNTNIPYLIEILNHDEFRSGKMTTRFIEKYFAEGLKEKTQTEQIKKWASEVNKKIRIQASGSGAADTAKILSPWESHWRGV